LTTVHPRRAPRARNVLSSLLLAALATCALGAASAQATPNANDYQCFGKLSRGTVDPSSVAVGYPVKYKFSCPGPINGYQIQPQIGDLSFDTDTIVLNSDGSPVTTDAFSCNGDFPGFGFNCIGTYTGPIVKTPAIGATPAVLTQPSVEGQFNISTKLCAEPRVDALLTVAYATATNKGVVTQALAGPFDLGRPKGCGKGIGDGSSRVPYVDTTAANLAKKKAAAKKAAAKKKAAKKHATRKHAVKA
jgi:hypothetical protein